MAMAEARDYRPLNQVPTIAERDCLMIGITDLARHAERCPAGGTTDDGAARGQAFLGLALLYYVAE
jgi:hypothetical protein